MKRNNNPGRPGRVVGLSRRLAIYLAGLLIIGSVEAFRAERRADAAGRVLIANAVKSQEGPKVLLYYDMEGISGANDPKQVLASHPDLYKGGREFLTGDVNAAVRGLKAGGAGAIVVTDAHGSGNSQEPDILLDQLDKRATFEFKDHEFDPYSDMPDPTYKAIVCIGMHARANTPGFMAHTFTVEPDFRVNGKEITETEIIAHSAARFRTPVIMVSGDDVLEKQIHERFPLAEYGLVKRARGRASAELLSQDEAHANIENAARRAIAKLDQFKPYPVASEYKFEMSFQNEAQADLAALYPGLNREGETTVEYVTPTFIEGYDRSKVLIRLAGSDRYSLLMMAVRSRPDGKEIMAEYEKLLLTRWLEPDKMPPAPKKPPKPKRYFGDS